jgi:hypothetical protein
VHEAKETLALLRNPFHAAPRGENA